MKLVWRYRATGGWTIERQPSGFVHLKRHGVVVMETRRVDAAQLEAQRITDQENPAAALQERRIQQRAWRKAWRARKRLERQMAAERRV
jgi:hypothetical protein